MRFLDAKPLIKKAKPSYVSDGSYIVREKEGENVYTGVKITAFPSTLEVRVIDF